MRTLERILCAAIWIIITGLIVAGLTIHYEALRNDNKPYYEGVR